LAQYLKWGKRKGGRCAEHANAGGKIARFRVGIISLIRVFTASSERGEIGRKSQKNKFAAIKKKDHQNTQWRRG
jgi:hypothetical protein